MVAEEGSGDDESGGVGKREAPPLADAARFSSTTAVLDSQCRSEDLELVEFRYWAKESGECDLCDGAPRGLLIDSVLYDESESWEWSCGNPEAAIELWNRE